MSTGMLWFDDSQTELSVKIQKAAEYYQKKYGSTADLCLVHPSMIGDDKPKIEGLKVRPYRPVLPGLLWIGIEDEDVSG